MIKKAKSLIYNRRNIAAKIKGSKKSCMIKNGIRFKLKTLKSQIVKQHISKQKMLQRSSLRPIALVALEIKSYICKQACRACHRKR